MQLHSPTSPLADGLKQLTEPTRSLSTEAFARLSDLAGACERQGARFGGEVLPDTDILLDLRALSEAGRKAAERAARKAAEKLGRGIDCQDEVRQVLTLDRSLQTVSNAVEWVASGRMYSGERFGAAVRELLRVAGADHSEAERGLRRLPGGPLEEWRLTNPIIYLENETLVGVVDGDNRFVPSPPGARFVQAATPAGSRQSFYEVPSGRHQELIPIGAIGREEGKRIEFTYLALRESGPIGSELAAAYAAALETHPDIRATEIRFSDPTRSPVLKGTGGYAVHQGSSENGRPVVVIHGEQTRELYANLRETRETSSALSAEKMGVTPRELSPELLAVFIFLHELGHTYDFLKNVPTLELKKSVRAAELNRLPVPGVNPVKLAELLEPGGALDWNVHSHAFRANGFPTKEKLLKAQEKAYHSIRSEDVPDRFAAEVALEGGFICDLAYR